MNDNIFMRYFNGEMDIYNYLKPNNNDMISSMYGSVLTDFLYYLDKCYLDYRDSLNINDDITFGFEIEFEHIDNYNQFKKEFNNKFNNDRIGLNIWHFKKDISLFDSGAEVSSPILRDKSDIWNDFYDICEFISMRAKIGKHCAGQINVGAHVLGSDVNSWTNFILLWSVYENVIFRFLYGDYLSFRRNILMYSKPLSNMFFRDYLYIIKADEISLEDILNKIKYTEKRYAIDFFDVNNFNEIKWDNVIEFRSPNGSLDPVIWQNNLNLLIKMLEYSKRVDFDSNKILDRREKNFGLYSELVFYDEVYLEQALELCDLIFDNNLDKIYFMRQYLKSFKVDDRAMVLAKPFTRKRNKYYRI